MLVGTPTFRPAFWVRGTGAAFCAATLTWGFGVAKVPFVWAAHSRDWNPFLALSTAFMRALYIPEASFVAVLVPTHLAEVHVN